MPKLAPEDPLAAVSTGVALSKPAYAVAGPSLTTCRSRAIPEVCKRALLSQKAQPKARPQHGGLARCRNATHTPISPTTTDKSAALIYNNMRVHRRRPVCLAPDHLDYLQHPPCSIRGR